MGIWGAKAVFISSRIRLVQPVEIWRTSVKKLTLWAVCKSAESTTMLWVYVSPIWKGVVLVAELNHLSSWWVGGLESNTSLMSPGVHAIRLSLLAALKEGGVGSTFTSTVIFTGVDLHPFSTLAT